MEVDRMITFGMVLDGSMISSPFSATNLAPPQAKLKSATPVKKFLGPLGMMFFVARFKVPQFTLGRPNTINVNRLTIRNATMHFWTLALDWSPIILTPVQTTSANMAMSDSLKPVKMEQK